MTTENEELRATNETIDFGMEVEAFIQSRLGRYLIGRAEEDIAAAVETLKRTDPENAKTIRELQNAIYRAESIGYWLADAVQAGFNAEREFTERGTD
jgi:hypothetical protein